jgi:enterochelin esterase-like enzyme
MLKILFLLLPALIVGSLQAKGFASLPDCKQITGRTKWSYCISNIHPGSAQDIVYYFHGRGENERTFFFKEGLYPRLRESMALSRTNGPIVVTVSFGAIALLTERNSRGRSGLLDAFISQVLPTVEHQLGGIRGRRLLLGESLGGYSAAQLYLKYPSYFSKVALLCPALTRVGPFSKVAQISQYAKRTSASPRYVLSALALARLFYANSDEWENGNTLLQAARLLNSSYPPLHVQCGLEDQYGFYEGAHDLTVIARSRGVLDVSWKLVHGSHCSFDPDDVAKFLRER